jgi:predicted TIM-barrel fold metal-dependent hydrolase
MSDRIDVHHHFYAPEYNALLEGSREGLAGLAKTWTPEASLADMDRNGTGMALLSAAADAELPRDTARACNEYAAVLMKKHSGRFGLFGVLPMPDVEGSLQEIPYALDVLGAQGIGMLTSYAGAYLGDPAFWPVFEELDRRNAVVFVHPTLNACCAGLVPDVGPTVIEFGTDTTRAIASLVFGGAAAKFQNIRFIFCHGGGTMPFLIGRFVNLARTPRMAERLPNGLLPELQRFYYETAQVSNRGAMASLRELVPASQVLFGTDFPYRKAEDQIEGLASSGFSASELGAIGRTNALQLLDNR